MSVADLVEASAELKERLPQLEAVAAAALYSDVAQLAQPCQPNAPAITD
jgi:hypothetical protein